MNRRALRPVWVSTFVAAVAVQLLVPFAATSLPSAAAAVPAVVPPAAGAITLHVQAARSVNSGPGFVHKGDAITTYKWLVNVDDTGDPGTAANQLTTSCLPATAGVGVGSTDPNYADTCPWPSVRNTAGQAPIVAQGTQADLSDTAALPNLPGGKYLISVTADGYKIAGAHFKVDGGTQRVLAQLDPTPLPLTTLRISVFNDMAPVDATYEVDAEPGLPGFTAHLTDVLGTVSTDYYGNALCTTYLHDPAPVAGGVGPMQFDAGTGRPVVDPASIGRCVSDATGEIVIPNLGPNRYAATVTPPVPAAGQTFQWVETTTLEGGHDTDIWSQENATGYDTEQTKGAELVPNTQFGFVATQALPTRPAVTGELKGTVVAELPYIGGVGGQQNGEYAAGAKKGPPIADAWVALSNLALGDQVVYVGRAATDGTFDLKNVPVGDYQVSLWDDNQDYILWSFNATVAHNAVTDVGLSPLVGWFTHVSGHVFIDSNGNGKRDPGEQPVPAFGLTVRERDNSLMDQATNTMTTDDTGLYDIRETYPMGKWLVLEAFNTRYQTTGVTYKSDNETTGTTILGGAVDIDFLPIIGLGATIDWGVQPYALGTNGGIVGTVTYDTTRNELDAADAATEPYQPGIAGIPVHLYASVPCTATVANIPNECRQGKEIVPLKVPSAPGSSTLVDNVSAERGAFVKGPELQDAYTSETWAPPRGCTARQYDGTPLTDQKALPEFGATANRMCVEAPMMGVTVGPSDSTPGAFSQTVNGNYGFATSKRNLYPPTDTVNNPGGLALYAPLPAGQEQDLTAADYIVSVEIPNDPVDGKPMYKVTSEEDVNVFDGDTYLPQENYPPATPADAAGAAGPGDKALAAPSQPPSQAAGIISPCVGSLHTVAVTNPAFLAGGGSPFEGYDQPLCGDKLVTVRAGQATAPNFNLFTDVPIPTHFWGLTLNDLGLSLDKRSVNYGEAQGIPFVPVGLYNWDGRLLDTTHTDFNGLYEALEPSTDTFNCPVPAGPCPNMYRFVGNDPGQPGQLNSDYNPRFRTIATSFQAWPGLYTVTDEAPTQVAATALTPDATVANPTMCDLGATAPQVLAVDRPYVRMNTAADSRVVTIRGFGFGATKGSGALTLNGTTTPTTSWSDTSITFTVPATTVSGAVSLAVTANNQITTVNGLTLQVLDAAGASTPGSTATNPRLIEVGPATGQTPTIQAALNAARPTSATPYWLVVVWPNAATADTPNGDYNENVVMSRRVRLQGVGPGGFDAAGTFVPGSIIDGSGFNPDNPNGAAWLALVGSINVSGGGVVADGADVTVLSQGGGFGGGGGTTLGYAPAIDGFQLTGGSQTDFAGNILDLGSTTSGESTGAIITQGGGVYAHANVTGLRVTDNVIRGNSGSYAGGVRVGTPYVANNRNYGTVISNNQIRDNGGTNLAGGIGLFAGSDGYKVTNNAICGNFSAEYGGAISAFGYQVHAGSNQPTPSIAHNRIWFNQSYDEGGGVFVAGELPSNPNNLSEGSGPVSIDGNVIQANLANDDGGGIRLLQTTGSHVTGVTPETINITNNTIANNVSAHEGGGIALDDALFVNIVNNTIAKNLTTATAVTSDGTPSPAGLTSAANSKPLQDRLATSLFSRAPVLHQLGFSKPTLLNNVFTDNRAGSFSGGWVRGIGGLLPDGSVNTINSWDMGVPDLPSQTLAPKSSVLQTTTGTTLDASNRVTPNAGLVLPYDVGVNILAFRSYPAFRQAVIVAELLPPTLMGDYHLTTGSVARGLGAASLSVLWGNPVGGLTYTVSAPTPDIDGQVRPSLTRYDAGSDQLP
ncbi:MAG: large repetitive protein [Actinomycetota bacterium]|nr:large repetitive protein [Actinomycetota bacterium]